MRARRQSRVAAALLLTGVTAVVSATAPPPAAGPDAARAVGAAHPSLSVALGGGRAFQPEVRRPGEGALGDPRAASIAHLPAGAVARARSSAVDHARRMPPAAPGTGARWVERGPAPVDYAQPYAYAFTGWGRTSGRVVALAVDPRDRTGDTVYAGTSAGGLWRSRDAGRQWAPLFQDQASSTVGAVVVEAGTGVVHVGTGEPNYNLTSDPGTGVYRSHDDGRTWLRATGIPDGAHVHRIALGRPGTVFAATSRGLFRSTDGGASYVDVVLPTNASGTAPYTATAYGSVVTDVVVKPDDPERITAVVGWWLGGMRDPVAGVPQSVGNGLYRSTAGGLPGTWTRMDSPTFGRYSTSGDPIGRVTLAYAAGPGQDADVMWALIQDAGLLSGKPPVLDTALVGRAVSGSVSYLNGVYRSGDDGATWELKGDPLTLSHAPGSVYADTALLPLRHVGAQAWFNQYLAVDPADDRRVVLGLEEVFVTEADPAAKGPARWTTIGRFWSSCRYAYFVCTPSTEVEEGRPTPHPDHHAVAVVATPAGTRIYDGSDGGVAVLDEQAGRFDNDAWQMRNDGIGSAKSYYAVMGRDGQILTGLQDNGTVLVGPDQRYGVAVFGADGGAVAIDPEDPDVMYAETQDAGFRITVDGGATWRYAPPPDGRYAFITPFSLDAADGDHLLIGGETVHVSDKGSATTSNDWVPVFSLQEAGSPPVGPQVRLATATELHAGSAYVTWCLRCDVGFSPPDQVSSGLATNVTPGCGRTLLDAACWRHAAGRGLPQRLLTDVAVDRRDPRVVVVGVGGYASRWWSGDAGDTDGHVFLSRDAGESFVDISHGLPDVPVNSVVLRDDEVHVGTDVGVFRAARPGASFVRLGSGLPTSPVFDVTLNPQRDALVAATHGRGVWTLALGAAVSAPAGAPRQQSSRTPTARRYLPATGAGAPLVVLGIVLLLGPLVVRRRRLSTPGRA